MSENYKLTIMKELSIEEKAKRYDEALEWMKSVYPTLKGADKEDAEHYIPELTEYKDEWIRKRLLDYFNCFTSNTFFNNVSTEDAITWLEKQSKDSPVLSNSSNTGKPAWSEEDEERLSDAIFFVREYQIPTRDKRLLNAAKEAEDWLKSLRSNNTWKPSERQMMAIDTAINVFGKCTLTGKHLIELYQDLKKLKGEEV